MLKRIVNLPFKVIGKAARAVQDRNDAAMKETHGTGTVGDDWSQLDNVPEWDTPDDFDPGRTAISIDDLKGQLDDVFLVDIRHPREVQKGTIPGAENLPIATLSIRLAELPANDKIVVFGDNSKDAKETVRFLRFRGIEDSWHLWGGLKAWKQSGGDVRS